MSVLAGGSPTVTIFADHGPLVSQIGEELRARGAATHTVSIEAGWVDSTSYALVLLDSPAGISAVRDLCDRAVADVHVVALLADEPESGVEELCDRCAERHGLVMIRATEDDLVARVVDEVVGGPRP